MRLPPKQRSKTAAKVPSKADRRKQRMLALASTADLDWPDSDPMAADIFELPDEKEPDNLEQIETVPVSESGEPTVYREGPSAIDFSALNEHASDHRELDWTHVEGFLLSPDFRDFCATVEAPNLFQILRITGDEILNSRMLAFLFDPRAAHGCGQAPLREFLAEMLADPANAGKAVAIRHKLLTGNLHDYSVGTEVAFARDDIYGRIDLLIESAADKLVIAIENKLWAGEQDEQLSRYQRYLVNHYPGWSRFLVFLSPSGGLPATGDTQLDGDCPVLVARHGLVARAIGRCIERAPESSRWVLQHFKDHLERHVAEDMNLLRRRARDIWSNRDYREALDTLMRYRPGIGDPEVRERYQEMVLAGLGLSREQAVFQFYPSRGALTEIHLTLRSWQEAGLPFRIWFYWASGGEPDVMLAVLDREYLQHQESFSAFAHHNTDYVNPAYPKIANWDWRWVRKEDGLGSVSHDGFILIGDDLAERAAERAVKLAKELDERIKRFERPDGAGGVAPQAGD